MNPDFSKYPDGLIPAIIQDYSTRNVLMLGFMNAEALEQTKATGRVTFFSRSKQRLWMKGEESGNFLSVVNMLLDCDNDTLLIAVKPEGPVCHTGTDTCWGERNEGNFLRHLEAIINERKSASSDSSYTAELFSKGINKVAQKVGEEAVELIIEAKDDDRVKFLGEAADLLYHYMVLLAAKGYSLDDVEGILRSRHEAKK